MAAVWDIDPLAQLSVVLSASELRAAERPDEFAHLFVVDEDLDLDRVLSLCVELHEWMPIDRVVATNDRWLPVAARIAERLELDGTSVATADAVNDKLLQRRRLAERGVDDVAASSAVSLATIDEFGRTHGWPVVIKPRRGCGSIGVTTGVGPQAIGEAWARAVSVTDDTRSGEALVEQQVSGRIMTVDSFSRAGTHTATIVGFESFAREAPVVVMTATTPPVPADWTHRAIRLAHDALDALDVRDGPSHVELAVTADDAHIIEVQLRPGGDYAELTLAVTEIDVYALWAAHVCGRDVESPQAHPRAQAASMLWAGPQQPGVVVAVVGADRAESSAGVGLVSQIASPPYSAPEVRSLLHIPVGVLAVGSDSRQATRRAHDAFAGVAFRSHASARCLPTPHEPTATSGGWSA
ncbi:acetyl-CoA carboxylase biotin carboxylase subunit family protein [Microbacterium sp. SLBN-146]|uniref:ATP-grasp domain-containing protein n=1 Tax=Microbacterium sp. SLBN-146 TaxID=2768457 RepID=UPI0011521EA4|nr:ATP-grasp domain-containing protein [Microbacterium sp. SLBN-146]